MSTRRSQTTPIAAIQHVTKPLKPRNKLNLRIRHNTAATQKTLRAGLGIQSIRVIDNSPLPEFDYDRLDAMRHECDDHTYETENVAEQRTNEVLARVFDETSQTWSLKSLNKRAATGVVTDSEEELLIRALDIISISPTAKSMLREVRNWGWKLALSNLDEHDFHLDIPEKTAYLDSHGMDIDAINRTGYFMNTLVIALIRAMRDVWQEKRHGGFETIYAPENVLLMERIRSADLDTISVMVAWDLKQADYGDVWRHLIASEAGDIAMAFNISMRSQDTSYGNAAARNNAMTAAFLRWFHDTERVDECDHEVLDYMDSIVENTSYNEQPFGARKPNAIGIEILSCLPDKTTYLKGWGDDILNDPQYSGLGNDINQSHLLQIISDLNIIHVGGVAFRDINLAQKMFPETAL